MSIKIDFGEILLRANVTSDNLCSAKIKMFLLPPCARVFWLVITLHQILIKFLGSYLTEKREKMKVPRDPGRLHLRCQEKNKVPENISFMIIRSTLLNKCYHTILGSNTQLLHLIKRICF